MVKKYKIVHIISKRNKKEENLIAGYVRISKDDNKNNYSSIENQKKIISQYARGNGFQIDKWYEDDGISGYTFERPGFLSLLNDLEEKKGMVVVKDLSRLGRHNARILLLLEQFKKEKKRVVSVDDHYDSFESEDDLIGIKTWFNERYVKDISCKIRTSIHARQKDGTLDIQPPFGYIKEKGKLKIVPQEKECIEEIFQLYIQGYGYRRLAQYLTEHHRKTPSMARHEHAMEEGKISRRKTAYSWSESMVREILANDFYIGICRLHKRERILIHGKDERVPKEKQYVFEHAHEPLISEELFIEANKIKERRNQDHYRGKTDCIFSGKVFCEDCKKKMTTIIRKRENEKRRYYICSCYNLKGKKGCSSSHIIEKEYLEEIVERAIVLCGTKENMDEKESKIQAEDKIGKEIEKKEKQLEEIIRQKVIDISVQKTEAERLEKIYQNLEKEVFKEIKKLKGRLKEDPYKEQTIVQKKEDQIQKIEVGEHKKITITFRESHCEGTVRWDASNGI